VKAIMYSLEGKSPLVFSIADFRQFRHPVRTKSLKPTKIGGAEMEQKEILKQMIAFNKTAFDNSFNAMVMVQEQTERMVNTFLVQSTWLPDEGKKVISDWVKAYKKGREDFKKLVDQSYERVEDFFASSD
jgi:predicted aminopeptidase